ncbi:MAG: hypothetical protein AAFX79_03900 [Planctomycetota bacterium]
MDREWWLRLVHWYYCGRTYAAIKRGVRLRVIEIVGVDKQGRRRYRLTDDGRRIGQMVHAGVERVVAESTPNGVVEDANVR